MINNPADYRTKDGSAIFKFSFERQADGSLRAYILSAPSYGSRSTGPHETHRLYSDGRHYVCWSNLIYTIEDLKKVVARWCEMTQRYIRTGEGF